jgi:hypothetical protein
MSEALIQTEMLEVCLDTKTVLRNCKKCGVEFEPVKRQQFCSDACRQAAYRDSPKYQERLRQKRDATFRRKMARRPYRYMTFDGRTAGPFRGPDKQRVRLQKDRGDLLFGAPRCITSRKAVEMSIAESPARSATE